MTGKMIIQAVNSDAYQLRVTTCDGECILECEPRQSKTKAIEDVETLRRNVKEDGRYAVQRNGQGHFAFNFLGESGETIGVSSVFPTPEGLGKAISALKELVPLAELVDNT
ncbi:MAG: YegP family protein [Acidobacteriota bacterium]